MVVQDGMDCGDRRGKRKEEIYAVNKINPILFKISGRSVKLLGNVKIEVNYKELDPICKRSKQLISMSLSRT